MANYYNDDFEEDMVPVKGCGSSGMISADDYNRDESNKHTLGIFKSVINFANALKEINSKESASTLKNMTDFISQTYLNYRFQNGLIAEDMKRNLLSRFNEVMVSCTPAELTDMYRAINEAGVADLDRIFGARSGGININMQGPTHNVYDNHVENQLNQQQNVYSNNENVMKSLEPKTVSSMTKMAEAAGVWGQIGVPRQSQVEYKPAEKIQTGTEKIATMLDATFHEIKAEEKNKLNEE